MSEPSKDLRPAQAAFVAAATGQYRDALDGRVVVVTGGARGLGRSLVEGLLRAGASVVSIDRTWSGAEAFQAALASDKKAMALTADVCDDRWRGSRRGLLAWEQARIAGGGAQRGS